MHLSDFLPSPANHLLCSLSRLLTGALAMSYALRFALAFFILVLPFQVPSRADIRTANDCFNRGGGVKTALACESKSACSINGKLICLDSEERSVVSPQHGAVKEPIAPPKAVIPNERAQ
jgi:hypothetical protein